MLRSWNDREPRGKDLGNTDSMVIDPLLLWIYFPWDSYPEPYTFHEWGIVPRMFRLSVYPLRAQYLYYRNTTTRIQQQEYSDGNTATGIQQQRYNNGNTTARMQQQEYNNGI